MAVAVLVDHLPEEVLTGEQITLRASRAAGPMTVATPHRTSRAVDRMRVSSVRAKRVQTCAVPMTIFAITRDCRARCTRMQTICALVTSRHSP